MTQEESHDLPNQEARAAVDGGRGPISRRVMLRAGLGAAGLLILSGCASSAGSASRNRVGQPIPDDPSVDPVRPMPRPEVPKSASALDLSLPDGVITRNQWARWGPRPDRAERMSRIMRITVHHDGARPLTSSTADAAARRLESIRGGHVSLGWADIGYHYAIDPGGRVWQGRPMWLQGAHVKGQNEGNIGIVMLGNFNEQRPTPRACAALDNLVASEARRHQVRLANIHTHQELAATACPGRYMQIYMNETRARGGRLVAMV